jgi:hypothetical protein
VVGCTTGSREVKRERKPVTRDDDDDDNNHKYLALGREYIHHPRVNLVDQT